MPALIREPCSQSVIDAQDCPEEKGRLGPVAQRRWVLAACILASSMAFIDGSALTVALPALRDDLGASLSTVQWVINSYVLSLAAFVLIGGAMADVYGKARMLTIGCVAFGAASAWCALAGSSEMLIAARFAQGLAAAIVAPASLALIGAVYPKKDRNKAIGAWASASALTTAGGPLLGGWLTETLGWPAIFWLNPPLAMAAIAILLVVKPADAREPRAFDIPGAAIMAVALALAAWGLSAIGPSEAAGHENAGLDISAEAVGAVLAGAALIGVYLLWERRTDHPMTPPRLFANGSFATLNLATLCIYAALSVIFFLMPFELIDRRGLSATAAGAAFLPFTLCVGFLSSPVGALADRVGAKAMLVAGSVAAGIAYVLFIVLRDADFAIGVLAPMGVLGVAFAAMIGPLTAAVMSSVEARDEGLASGVSNAASRIAQLFGVALAAGLATLAGGFSIALSAAALVSFLGAVVMLRGAPGETSSA
jgi:EmrB/QacA subfamily drug resistance transporter